MIGQAIFQHLRDCLKRWTQEFTQRSASSDFQLMPVVTGCGLRYGTFVPSDALEAVSLSRFSMSSEGEAKSECRETWLPANWTNKLSKGAPVRNCRWAMLLDAFTD